MSDTSILSLKNAQIFQADTLILSDVNLEINKGEFIYLIGKTGTGKSSLLKTLYGDIQLKQGSGLVANFDLATLTWKTVPMLRRNLGIIYQDFRLLTDRNVYENLEFVLKATGWKDALLIKEKIESVLQKVGLKNKGFKMPYEMSGGEQQRLSMARVFLKQARWVFADEATSALDEALEQAMYEKLLAMVSANRGALVSVAHRPSVAAFHNQQWVFGVAPVGSSAKFAISFSASSATNP